MKRNCDRCKALCNNPNGLGRMCQLGHEIKATEYVYEIPVAYKPLEECEKPLTYNQYCSINSKLKVADP